MLNKTLHQNILLLLLFVCYAWVLMAPLSSNINIPINEDYFNHFIAITEAKKALLQGQFPLRVFTLQHPQWLYPNFQFYSASTYTLAGLTHIFIAKNNPVIAFKIVLFLSLIFGGFYMYRLANNFLQSKTAALISSFSYISAPYILLNMNHLGAFNETVALCILPAVLFYTFQRYDHPKKKSALILMSFFWFLLATTHLITFVLSSFFIGLLLLWITCKNRAFLALVDTGIAYLWGILLSAWQLAPIFLYAKQLIIRASYESSRIFYLKSESIHQLLSPIGNISDILMKSSDVNTIILMHPNVGIPMLLAFGMSVYALMYRVKTHTRMDAMLLPIVVLSFFAFFLSWTPFNFWGWLPESFRFFQYPYRILGQVVWLGALLVGFSVRGFFPEKIDYAKIGLGILFILLCSSYWLFARQPFGLYSLQLAKYSNFNNDYLIDANQKSFNMDYKSLYQNNSIKKLQPIIIPPHPLNSFFIVFQAQTPKNTDKNLLGLFINETLIATKPLTYGPMVWSEEIGPTDQFTIFSYHVLDENKKILEKDWKNIPIDSIHLSGFTNLENVLNVKEVSPHCSQQKNSVYCELNVADKIHMMELPVYYFPDMLEVVLNGKKIHYQSIYYHDYLLTTVTPLAGKNNIQITFRGLVWANVLSLLFWGIWLGILIYVLGSWIKPRSSPMNGRRE